jgi:biopolymer transport protein ExbB
MAPLAKGVNILLAICSVYSLVVIVDRFFGLRRVRSRSSDFLPSLREQLKFRNLEGAIQLATQRNDNPVARLAQDALAEYRDGLALLANRPPQFGHADYDAVEAIELVIERSKEREVADLKRGLGGLASISSAAPFIGLFGTVVGIINAFRAMAATGQGGLGAVSAGISEALFTTAVGLVVAIPAVMTFNYFSPVIERFSVDLNGVGSQLVSYVLREGAANASPRAHQMAGSHRPPSMHPPSAHGPAANGMPSQHGPAAPVSRYPSGYPQR